MVRRIYVCPECDVKLSGSPRGYDHVGCRQARLTAPWTEIEVVARAVTDELADKLTLALRMTRSHNAKVNGQKALDAYYKEVTGIDP